MAKFLFLDNEIKNEAAEWRSLTWETAGRGPSLSEQAVRLLQVMPDSATLGVLMRALLGPLLERCEWPWFDRAEVACVLEKLDRTPLTDEVRCDLINQIRQWAAKGWPEDWARVPDEGVNHGQVRYLLAMVVNDLRVRGRKFRAKRAARSMGLAYWPALAFGPKIDPRAYKMAEDALVRGGHGLWGDRTPEGFSHGGWDSQGYYGISPWDVARAWYACGCRANAKFRAWLEVLQRQGADAAKFLANSMKRSWSYWETLCYIRGYQWLLRNNIPRRCGNPSAKVTIALGRLSAPLRWAAVEGVEWHNVIRVRHLNWGRVAEVQKHRRLNMRLGAMPIRGQWRLYRGMDVPKGLEAAGVSPWDYPKKAYEQLLRAVGIDPYEGGEGAELRLPAINLVRLFRAKGEVEKFLRIHCGVQRLTRGARTSLHDAGQFRFPVRFDREAWAGLAMKYGVDVLRMVGSAQAIEEALGRAPRSLNEARMAFTKVGALAEGVSLRVAHAAGLAGLSTDEARKLQGIMDDAAARRRAEFIPHVRVTGYEIGLDGDWVAERLATDDPVGPVLGLLTDCCQHPWGAGHSCARAGVVSDRAAFIVVRYRSRIVAQAYVWRGTGPDVDDVVFDSIEGLGTAYIEGVARLVREAASRMVGRLGVRRVWVGCTSYGLTKSVREAVRGGTNQRDIPQGLPSAYTDAGAGVWRLA